MCNHRIHCKKCPSVKRLRISINCVKMSAKSDMIEALTWNRNILRRLYVNRDEKSSELPSSTKFVNAMLNIGLHGSQFSIIVSLCFFLHKHIRSFERVLLGVYEMCVTTSAYFTFWAIFFARNEVTEFFDDLQGIYNESKSNQISQFVFGICFQFQVI